MRSLFILFLLLFLFMRRNHWILIGVVFFIALWSAALAFIGPQSIVEWIGRDHGYAVAFVIAALGGVSTFTASSFYLTIVTFASGGLKPWLLALVAGTGITIGDSLFFYLGTRGREVLEGRMRRFAEELSEWLKKRPAWVMPLIIFAYTGLTPLPNDILTVGLGLSGYPYKKAILPLWLGNITLTFLLALLAAQGYEVVV